MGRKETNQTNKSSKLGEINDIEYNKGSKIYPQNQVILDCIMPRIPLKHKCLSIILKWVIVSHYKKSKKKNKKLFLIGKIRHGFGKKRWLFSIGNGAEIWPLKMGRKSPGFRTLTILESVVGNG